MKACPYCAEEIQDAAKKCKHCGEMLVDAKYSSTEDIKAKKSPKSNISGSIFFGLIGSVFLGIFFPPLVCSSAGGAIMQCMAKGLTPTFLAYPVSIITFFIAYCIGDLFRKITKPMWIVTSNASETFQIKLFYIFGPQLIAWCIAGVLLAAMLASGIFVKNANRKLNINSPVPNGAFVSHADHPLTIEQLEPNLVPVTVSQSKSSKKSSRDTKNSVAGESSHPTVNSQLEFMKDEELMRSVNDELDKINEAFISDVSFIQNKMEWSRNRARQLDYYRNNHHEYARLYYNMTKKRISELQSMLR